MLENNTTYLLMRAFFDEPTRKFHMRQLSRQLKISQPSILTKLKQLKQDNLILRENTELYPAYIANRDNNLFKILKKQDIVLRLEQTGCLDYIYDVCLPDTIILFGSCALGEDIENSDIDLFILSPEKKLDLERFEKKLKRKINPFFCNNFENLPAELKNNVVNGIVLRGYLRAYDKNNSKQGTGKKHN